VKTFLAINLFLILSDEHPAGLEVNLNVFIHVPVLDVQDVKNTP